jgi:hypothetical protein
MANELTDSFDTLADTETWEHVVVLGAGYMGGTLLKNTVEGRMGVDVPDEAYGVAIAVGSGYFLDGDYAKFATLGGALYTGDALATRAGIKSKMQDATGGA